jgi:hypothetical protein
MVELYTFPPNIIPGQSYAVSFLHEHRVSPHTAFLTTVFPGHSKAAGIQ